LSAAASYNGWLPPWRKSCFNKEFLVADGHELGMWLRKAYLSFHRRANARMLKHGVTADQFVLLSVLVREEGITQVAIVERTASDPNTVAAILGLLERRGLVRREAHAQDRRARCVFLTAQGRRVQRRASKDAAPLLVALSDSMQGARAGDIERFLKRVHAVFSGTAATGNGAAKRPTAKAKATAS
jgi:DNA-binding MarR family transcriptional regulator